MENQSNDRFKKRFQKKISILNTLFISFNLILSVPLQSFAAGPVDSVNLRTSTKSQLPMIVVSSNGSRYTRIVTRQISMPVEFKARCNGQNKLIKTQLGVGKLPIFKGHMSDQKSAHSQAFPNTTNSKAINWQKHSFRIRLNSNGRFANIDPVKACNDFLNKKVQQGMRASFFMKKDRKMTMRYEISFAAECRQKWKANGLWKQTTQPAKAIIVCQARR